MAGLVWRSKRGRLVGTVEGVTVVMVERDRGYWFWGRFPEEPDWQPAHATAAEAKAAAEAWFLSRLAAAGE